MENPFSLGAHPVKTRSAPKKNWERTQLKLGAHLRKTRSAPRKNLPSPNFSQPSPNFSQPSLNFTQSSSNFIFPSSNFNFPSSNFSQSSSNSSQPSSIFSQPSPSKTARQVDKIFLSDTGALEEQKCRMKTAFLHISTQPYIYIFCFITTLHTPPRNSTQ